MVLDVSQNNHFLRCVVIGDFLMMARVMKALRQIRSLQGNKKQVDKKEALYSRKTDNFVIFSVTKKRSNNGVNLKTDC